MSHNVETMAYVGATPWHGLGHRVADAITLDEFLKVAGLEWEIELQQLAIAATGRPVDDRYAIVRKTDQKILDVGASSRWQPRQNRELFDFFRGFCADGGATIETAGSLKGGRLIWALADLHEEFVVNGDGRDRVKGYLLLGCSHEVGRGLVARVVTIRVVCNNTFSAAMSGSAKIEARWSHVGAWDPSAAAEQLGLVRANVHELEAEAHKLHALKLGESDVIRVLAPVFQRSWTAGPEDAARLLEKWEAGNKSIKAGPDQAAALLAAEAPRSIDGSADAVAMLLARPELMSPVMQSVMVSYRDAPGAEVGTGWGVLNGVTHYLDHVSRGDNADGRLASAWVGKGARQKQAVARTLSEMAA